MEQVHLTSAASLPPFYIQFLGDNDLKLQFTSFFPTVLCSRCLVYSSGVPPVVRRPLGVVRARLRGPQKIAMIKSI